METLDDYVARHSTPPDDYLHRLYRATHLHLLRPRMASGPVQGQLLRMLMQMVRPRTVVEIGTYSGYSALAMASGMPRGGVVHTFEVNDEQECFTRPWLEGAPYEARVEMWVGNVFELLPPMQLQVDVAYIDANKREYVDYYDLLMPFMHSGSLLLADNTLWDGHVVDPAYDRDAQTLAIRRFNDYVAADPRVEQLILSERDGLTLMRVR
ncbi:MAG: class I SAM-dependent methyltransferase [Bacteroidales bacterium]|nr:class I SAM-dependent methyltransferase [Bacteroidales bacterium]